MLAASAKQIPYSKMKGTTMIEFEMDKRRATMDKTMRWGGGGASNANYATAQNNSNKFTH